ncbi:MAG: sensory box histidine kinase/response regulator [Myxococcaceae bacterium]|nr:sensory box histidine kinase/response regulator [Myxococcaceae bacterium]
MEPNQSSQTSLSNVRILIAEDDPEMRAWLSDVLEPAHCEIQEAGSGWDLLDTVARQGPFSVIVTDVRMPGPSGLQVVELARGAGLETPFLVITAFPDEEVRAEAARFGHVVLLEKPFARNDFVEAILQLLVQYQQER